MQPRLTTERFGYRRRYEVAGVSEAKKFREFERACGMLRQREIEFPARMVLLSQHAIGFLENLADFLSEYPELSIDIQAYAGKEDDDGDPDFCSMLADRRAQTVRDTLVELGVSSPLSCSGRGLDRNRQFGILCFVLPKNIQLEFDVQRRVDLILSREAFEFMPQTEMFSRRGKFVAGTVARALREVTGRILITIPRMSSDTAVNRATTIMQAFESAGVVGEIVVWRSVKHVQDGCTITVCDGDGGLEGRLAKLLEATPLLFAHDRVDIVSDCTPVLQSLASMLEDVDEYIFCRVVVSLGVGVVNEADNGGLKPAEFARARAKRIAGLLEQLGVSLKFDCVGYVATEDHMGTSVLFSLHDVIGEKFLEVEDQGSATTSIGCLWCAPGRATSDSAEIMPIDVVASP